MAYGWISDFELRDGGVWVRQTGARLPRGRALFGDLIGGLAYYAPLQLKGFLTRVVRPGPRVWFTPDRPRPWYMVWNALAWLGARIARQPDQADVAFYFEDATIGSGPTRSDLRCLNGECLDVSKSHVARVFEAAFGYPLRIDPRAWIGPAVEKSEQNGAHDGQIIYCPQLPRPGRVYQRLVDTVVRGAAHDFRTPCVGGEPVLVFVKRRPAADRFANFNTTVELSAVDEVFTAAEVEAIRRFVRAMRLDWGGLDILRDLTDGRLYVVDVNKTDMPPLALRFRDKMRSARLLGEALRRTLAQADTGVRRR